MRLDELPLFDTLFTGVQQGEGGRGGAGEAVGMLGSDSAATSRARVWMLRALRDGEKEARGGEGGSCYFPEVIVFIVASSH